MYLSDLNQPPGPPARDPNSLPPRTPDSHGQSPRTCLACGADATNYAQCPVCRSTQIEAPA